MAEEEGFEPSSRSSRLTVFKTAGFNHSPTPPNGGGGRIRTCEGERQRVYSPSPLATREPHQINFMIYIMVREAGLEPARDKLPRDFKSLASTKFRHSRLLVGMGGLEPPNDGVKVRCLTTWRHPNIFLKWSRRRDSNPRPADYKSAALAN